MRTSRRLTGSSGVSGFALPLGGAPSAVALRLDDAAPADLEQSLDERVVQVSVGERRLDGHGQVGAGDADDSRRAPGDRRGHVEGRPAQEIAQDEDVAVPSWPMAARSSSA